MKSKRSISSVSSVIASLGLTVLLSACAGVYPEQQSSAPPVPNLEDPSQRSVSLLRYCQDLRDAGDLQLAAAMCRRAHELKPNDPEPLLQLGGIMQTMGMRDSAAEAYRAVLLIDPQRVDALYGLGKVHIDDQRYDMARIQLEQALQVANNDPRIYNALGVILDQQGDHATAQDYYREGLRKTPQSVSLRNNLGLSLVLDGDPQAGLALLEDVAAEPAAGAATSRNLALAHQMAALPAQNARQTAEAPPVTPAPVANVEIAEPPVQAEIAALPSAETAEPVPVIAAPAQTADSQVAPPPAETVANDLDSVYQAQPASIEDMSAEPETVVATPAETAVPMAPAPEPTAEPTMEIAAAEEPAIAPVRLLDGPVSPSIWETRSDAPAYETTGVHPPMEIRSAAVSPIHPDRTATQATAEIPAAPAVAAPAETPYPVRREGPMTMARAQTPAAIPTPYDGGGNGIQTPDLPIETAGAAETPQADEWIHSVQLSSVLSAERARESWEEIRTLAAEVLTGIDAVILRADLGEDMGVVYRVRTGAMEYSEAADLCDQLQTRGLDCFSVKASRQETIDATVERICAIGSTAGDCGGPLRNTALPTGHRNAG